jgi:hypothetical protein
MDVTSADGSAESRADRMLLAVDPRLSGMSLVRSALFPVECRVMSYVITPF